MHCEHTNSRVIQRIYTEKKVSYKNLLYIWKSVIIEVKKTEVCWVFTRWHGEHQWQSICH
jgi:hypothetical protein